MGKGAAKVADGALSRLPPGVCLIGLESLSITPPVSPLALGVRRAAFLQLRRDHSHLDGPKFRGAAASVQSRQEIRHSVSGLLEKYGFIIFMFTFKLNLRSNSEVLFFFSNAQTMTEQKMDRSFSLMFFLLLHHLWFFALRHPEYTCTLSSFSSSFNPAPILSVSSLAGSGLQHGLELSCHADFLLLLAHNALDGGRQATGVPGEDQGVAVLAAAVLLQRAAGVGDGVVVVVGVDHPVVVAWSGKRAREHGEVLHSLVCICVCGCVERGRQLTSAGKVAGQSLIVHEHLAGGGGVRDRVLGCHVSAHHPEAATGIKTQKTMLRFLLYVHVHLLPPRSK